MNSKFPVKLDSSIPIPGEVLQELIKREGLQQQELADLLNVSPSTLSAWMNPNTQRGPTSTMELILFTILIGNNIIELPDPDPEAFHRYLLSISSAGLLKPNDLKDSLTIERLKKAFSVQNNSLLLKSRKLLNALNKAWANIDSAAAAQ